MSSDNKRHLKLTIGAIIGVAGLFFAAYLLLTTPASPKEQLKETMLELSSNEKFMGQRIGAYKLSDEKVQIVKNTTNKCSAKNMLITILRY